MKNTEKFPSPSQQKKMKPAPVAGSDIIGLIGDWMGTGKKYINYTPAEIYRGKKWFVSYRYRNPESRKLVRFKVYKDINRKKGADREEYAELLRKGINEVLRRGYNPFHKEPLQVAVKNWTLVQGLNYFKQHLYDRGLRQRTIQSYETVLKMLYRELDSIKNEPIDSITRHQITTALRNAKSGTNKRTKRKWSNSTYNNNITSVRAIFGFLIQEDITAFNPARYVKKLPESITKHRYFDDATFKRIKEKADHELLEFMMFLYHTGTRPAEARQLTSEHILVERKLLFIPAHISKNKKDDYVPLTDYVLKNYTTPGRLFPRSINFYGQKFRKVKKALRLDDDFTLYSIKATRAIHLAQDGADPYTIMNLFRHSGLDITMNYLRDLGVALNREATTKGIRF
jgi:integrase